ncbi:MAG TPA: FkbM family methyltransferase [Dehalococcoidia bacterium]|nr:FkbM family methyltransferase [Dehalococcoidia bacterium]
MVKFIRRFAMFPLLILEWISSCYTFVLTGLSHTRPNFWLDRQSRKNDQITREICHKNNLGECRLTFYTPNWLCWDRASTFSVKEPETLSWIDEFGGAGAMFDIGANVGLYSLYYAKTKGGNAYAFEPAVFNLPILVKNIAINQLQSKISVIPLPLTQENGLRDFSQTTTIAGGAYSTYGVDFGWDGLPLAATCQYKLLGCSLDFLLKTGLIKEVPTMIKLDVDGIEHLILKGAAETLRHPTCRTVLVEISKVFVYQRTEIKRILSTAGFILDIDRLSDSLSDQSNPHTFNQLWVKPKV